MTRVSWWSIALRNLMKNPRRTLFTVWAIALGYAAITVFGGFTNYVFTSLREAQIYAQADGHLMLYKEKLYSDPKAESVDRYVTEENLEYIRGVVMEDPDVLLTTTQLGFRGILSNGEISTVFIGVGKVWSDVERIRSLARGIVPHLRLYEGDPIRDELEYGIGIGKGLSRILSLPQGMEGIAVAPTLEGQINALDARVVQITDAPSVWLENVVLVAPLTFAQGLLHTDWVDRLTIVLRRGASAEEVKERLVKKLHDAGHWRYWALTWREMSPMYVKTEKMFNVIFLFVFGIIALISVLIVVNTTSMAITERTREIGTLRALGIKRRGILAIFARESILLGVIGSTIGALLALGTRWAILWSDLTWTPPTLSRTIPFMLDLVPMHMFWALVGMVLISLCAALFPARHAARMDIVDALGHV